MSDALLVVDVQHGLVAALPPERGRAFVTTVAGLIARARARGTDVVFVRHHEAGGLRTGTPAWEIERDVRPRTGDVVIDKSFGDAFEKTALDDALRARDIDHLIVCGMQSDHCVDATARGGARRDYRVTVVEDAHATYDDDGEREDEIRKRVNRGLREGGIGLVRAANALRAEALRADAP